MSFHFSSNFFILIKYKHNTMLQQIKKKMVQKEDIVTTDC